MEVIRDNDLSVEYLYAFTNQQHMAYVILRLNDNKKAIRVLNENGVRVISQEELCAV